MTTQTHIPPTVSDPPWRQRPRRRLGRLLALVVTLPLLLGGFAVWWFVLRHDAPAAVSLDAAVEGVSTDVAGSSPDASAGSASRTWVVDTTITNAEGTGTFAGFRVEEELVGVGAATAVGRSGDVSGSLTVEGTRITAAQFTANLTAMTSNDSRRVNAIGRALATSQFPTATFVLTEPFDVGSVPAEGERISASAVGDLTVHGVTRPTAVAIEAQLENGVLVVVGSAPVTFADFGITAPTAPIVAAVDDHGVIEIQLYLVQS